MSANMELRGGGGHCMHVHKEFFHIKLSILCYYTKPFTFVYRTADIYLCTIKTARQCNDISGSVHKYEWHSISSDIYMKNKKIYFCLFREGGGDDPTCPLRVFFYVLPYPSPLPRICVCSPHGTCRLNIHNTYTASICVCVCLR